MKYLRYYSILLFMGLFAGVSLAEPTPESRGLRGTVEDTSGAVIPGAQITITTQDGKTAAESSTDKSGNFHFADLPPGSYFRQSLQGRLSGSQTFSESGLHCTACCSHRT